METLLQRSHTIAPLENESGSSDTPEDIINPEVPATPKEKLELLQRCMAAIAAGLTVEGVTPKHVSSEGDYMIRRAKLGLQRRSGL